LPNTDLSHLGVGSICYLAYATLISTFYYYYYYTSLMYDIHGYGQITVESRAKLSI